MTLPDTRAGTVVGIHATYPNLPYELDVVGRHFLGVNQIWRLCYWTAWFRQRPPLSDVYEYSEWREALRGRGNHPPPLIVQSLSIQSPMDLSLVVQGGLTAASVYSLHLLVRVMRDPERLGSWLPRLVAGWHKGMREVEDAWRSRQEPNHPPLVLPTGAPIDEPPFPPVQELQQTADERLRELKPDVVSAEGIGGPPDDLREASGG